MTSSASERVFCSTCGYPMEGIRCDICGGNATPLELADGAFDPRPPKLTRATGELGAAREAYGQREFARMVTHCLAAEGVSNVRTVSHAEGPGFLLILGEAAISVSLRPASNLLIVESPLGRLGATHRAGAMRLSLELSARAVLGSRVLLRKDLLLLRLTARLSATPPDQLLTLFDAASQLSESYSRVLQALVDVRPLTLTSPEDVVVESFGRPASLGRLAPAARGGKTNAMRMVSAQRSSGAVSTAGPGLFDSIPPILAAADPHEDDDADDQPTLARASSFDDGDDNPTLARQSVGRPSGDSMPPPRAPMPAPRPAAGRPASEDADLPPVLGELEPEPSPPPPPPKKAPVSVARGVSGGRPNRRPSMELTMESAKPHIAPKKAPPVAVTESAPKAPAPQRSAPEPASKPASSAMPAPNEPSVRSDGPGVALCDLLHQSQALGAALSFEDKPASMMLLVRATVFRSVFEHSDTVPHAVAHLFHNTANELREIYITAPGVRRGAMAIPSADPAFSVMEAIVKARGNMPTEKPIRVKPITSVQEAKQHLARYVSEIEQAPDDTALRHFLALGALCELLVRTKLPAQTQTRLREIVDANRTGGARPQGVQLMMTALKRIVG